MNPGKGKGQGVSSTLNAEKTYGTNCLDFATTERRRKALTGRVWP